MLETHIVQGILGGDDGGGGGAPGEAVKLGAEGGGDEKVIVDQVAGALVPGVGWDAPAGDFSGPGEDLELGGGALGEEEGVEAGGFGRSGTG